jgi:hypothetical protein
MLRARSPDRKFRLRRRERHLDDMSEPSPPMAAVAIGIGRCMRAAKNFASPLKSLYSQHSIVGSFESRVPPAGARHGAGSGPQE